MPLHSRLGDRVKLHLKEKKEEEQVCQPLGETVKPFTETRKMGHGIRFGGSHGDVSQPQGVWVEPRLQFLGQTWCSGGRAAPGLPYSHFQASPKPVLCHQSKERKPSAEMNRITTKEATSSCPPKAPLGETRQKLWRSLKMLPERGQRVRQQLKSHLTTVNLSSLLDVRRSTVISGPGTGKGSQDHSGDPTSGDRGYTDPCVATSLKSPSQPQAPKDRKVPTRKAERSVSCIEVTPGDRSWHQMVVRALSSQESKPEHQGLAEPENDQLPEEYQQPPPFAPGYC